MKKLIKNLMLCSLAGAISLFTINFNYAQTTTLNGVTRDGFKGVKKMDENGYYIQFTESEGTGKNAKKTMRLMVLGNSLQTASDFKMEIKSSEKIEDVAYNNGKFMVITSSYSDQTRTFRIMDRDGKELTKKELTNVNRRLLNKTANIIPLDTAGFLVINYVKDKRKGYSLELYNDNLEPKYSHEYIPEKKNLYPVDCKISGGMMYILEFLSPDYSDYFEYHIAGVDLASGKMLFNNTLVSADGKAHGYATFLKLSPAGNVITAGMYFNNDHEKSANSDGFFGAVTDKSGKINFNYKDWNEVKDQLKNKSTSTMWGGKTKTFIHDVDINADGTFTLIGENYRRGDAELAGGKNRTMATLGKLSSDSDDPYKEAVTISEFALFDFDAGGSFKSLRKISKPETVTIIKPSPDDPPFVGEEKGLNLANILNNNGRFPYRFTAEKGTNKVLVYDITYEKLYTERLYFTRLNAEQLDTASVEITNSVLQVQKELDAEITKKQGSLGKLMKKMDASNGDDIQNEFYVKGSEDPHDFRAKEINSRVLPSNIPGKVLVYDFAPPESTSQDSKAKKNWISSYYTNMDAAMAGNLKISYVDIP
ncbi:MAG: hypothetical protein ABIT08_12960 [Bacteroidia bacterium]